MTNYKLTAVTLIILTLLTIACNSHHPKVRNVDGGIEEVEKSEYDSTVFANAYHQLKYGDTLAQATIDSFAKQVDTRADLYDLLEKFEKQYLFPKEYISFEKATESRLVIWLLFPTELDTLPAKIELLKKVAYVQHDTTFNYYVYQFKTEEPHWAAKDGWMIGVVGPYFNYSNPYDWAKGTFSRFTKANATSPEKEVEWVHKNIYYGGND